MQCSNGTWDWIGEIKSKLGILLKKCASEKERTYERTQKSLPTLFYGFFMPFSAGFFWFQIIGFWPMSVLTILLYHPTNDWFLLHLNWCFSLGLIKRDDCWVEKYQRVHLTSARNPERAIEIADNESVLWSAREEPNPSIKVSKPGNGEHFFRGRARTSDKPRRTMAEIVSTA